tara:strand:+ start:246 stop:425 length:180 start_codon:yes stop_codon:yes gene_type:complete
VLEVSTPGVYYTGAAAVRREAGADVAFELAKDSEAALAESQSGDGGYRLTARTARGVQR